MNNSLTIRQPPQPAPHYPQPAPVAPTPETFELREVWISLLRRKFMIFGIIVLGCILGLAFSFTITPSYTAYSKVMLETRNTQFVQTEQVVSGLIVDAEVIEGEIEFLRSRNQAAAVAERLDLISDPEFNPTLEQDPEFSIGALVAPITAFARNLVSEAEAPVSAEEAELFALKEVVDSVIDHLDVRQIGDSPVIQIGFSSESPTKASRLANAIAEAYIEGQLALKSEVTGRASDWLGERITELQTEVEDKERQIEQLRSKLGLYDETNLSGANQQLTEATTQLVQARGDRAATEARLRQVEEQLAANVSAATSVEVLNSPVIQDLKLQSVEKRRLIAELSSEFGPRHPTLIQAERELEDINRSIQGEIQAIIQGLRNQVVAAREREISLQQTIDELSERAGGLNSERVELRALERQASASRVQLETFLTRQKETAEQENIQQADARLISNAAIPDDPSSMSKRLILLLSFCGSAFFGVGLAYALEAADGTFRSVDHARRALGIQLVHNIPAVRLQTNGSAPDLFAGPPTAYTESFHHLQVGLTQGGAVPLRTVVFSSSLPSEGKTSTTISFGRSLRTANQRVVVLDCDLRKPRVHEVLGGRRNPGLVDYLMEFVDLEAVVQVDRMTGLHYIAAGSPTPNPTGLLSLPALPSTINALATYYDAVLIDSAPILPVADGLAAARLAERCVFVVRWGKTKRAVVSEAFGRLQNNHINVSAVALSCVNIDKYHLYDDGGYYKESKGYYTH